MNRPSCAVPLRDRLERQLGVLRISVTDRCNLRCVYCMPDASYVWLPRSDLLRFEEIVRLAGIFAGLGVEQLRLTGGEPLLRRDLPRLVSKLARVSGVNDLAMTTNGLLLPRLALPLREAGLRRLSVSLDTLRPERFRQLSSGGELQQVLDGIEAARRAGFERLKIDTVVMRGINDDELPAMLEFGRSIDAEVRFIEYMDVGGATRWSAEHVVSRAEMLQHLAGLHGSVEPVGERTAAPAERFRLPDGTTFGIIGSTTAPFCRSCVRSRLTADGVWYLCLYASDGIDLRSALRQGATDAEIAALIESAWRLREDRAAELRQERAVRGPLLEREQLALDPHLEMHTRGG